MYRRETDESVKIPAQTTKNLRGATLSLCAHLEVEEKHDGFHFQLHIYLDRKGDLSLGGFRSDNPIHPGIEELKNWLLQLSWGNLYTLLNPQRSWPEARGGFTLGLQTEFSQLIQQLHRAL